uniref:Uncharacterized protein n=1 Tax=Anguilla anguilla TaxID=7936 RepID=A0A0E9URH3_ANGAN
MFFRRRDIPSSKLCCTSFMSEAATIWAQLLHSHLLLMLNKEH